MLCTRQHLQPYLPLICARAPTRRSTAPEAVCHLHQRQPRAHGRLIGCLRLRLSTTPCSSRCLLGLLGVVQSSWSRSAAPNAAVRGQPRYSSMWVARVARPPVCGLRRVCGSMLALFLPGGDAQKLCTSVSRFSGSERAGGPSCSWVPPEVPEQYRSRWCMSGVGMFVLSFAILYPLVTADTAQFSFLLFTG